MPRRFDASCKSACASRGSGLRQIASIEIGGMGLAAGCDALIRRHRSIAIDEVDAIEWHAQFFGDELNLRRGHALPDFFFAGVRRHVAVGANRNPGIDLVRGRRSCNSSGKVFLRVGRFTACPAMLKVTISAPVPFKKDRRENPALLRAASASGVSESLSAAISSIGFSSGHFLSGVFDGSKHSHVREAPAQNARHPLLNFCLGGFRILIQKSLRGQNDAVQAKTALRGLLRR